VRHPQQSAPDAIACSLAAGPQQLFSAFASADVPQQVLGSRSTATGVGLPQHPLAAGGANASAVVDSVVM